MSTQNIYLDEAGFTGANLLDPVQPVFVYASVGIDDSEARAIHAEMLTRFKIQGEELKGGNLVKTSRGQKAVSWLLKNTSQFAKAAIADKEYALAGKFFEYIIEPIISKQNSLFYYIDFHKFVSMVVYCEFKRDVEYARNLMEDFQRMLRENNTGLLKTVLSANGYEMEPENPLTHILTIALCHQEIIKNDIMTLKKADATSGWALEMSAAFVHYLLASWGEQFKSLRVYCDDSKPISSNLHLFQNLIGRTDKFYMWMHDNPSFVYNLSEPIHLVDSKKFPGVQIADVWASALAYAYNHPDDVFAKECREIAINEGVIVNIISPELENINVNMPKPFLNWSILTEMSRLSIVGEHPINAISQYIPYIIANYGTN